MKLKAQIDRGKNFVRFVQPANKQDIKMVRWGWVEDNIITKYSTFVGSAKVPLMTLRSIQFELNEEGLPESTDKSSVLIQDHKMLRAIAPFHSMIFKTDVKAPKKKKKNMSDSQLVEAHIAKVNEKMVSGNSRQFDHKDDSKKATANKEGKGYLRNIFINVEVIQKHFGINVDGLGEATEPGFYTQGIDPPSSIAGAVMSLMNDVSLNFFSHWEFELVGDAENPTNTIIIDKLSSRVKDYGYTEYLNTELGNPSTVRSLGVYKFPSMNVSSLVKQQNFEVSFPQGQSATAFWASLSHRTQPSSNLQIRASQQFATIQNLNRDAKKERSYNSGLRKLYLDGPEGAAAGYPYGNEDRKVKYNSDFNHKLKVKTLRENKKDDDLHWKKYSPKPIGNFTGLSAKDDLIAGRELIYTDGRFHFVKEGSKSTADTVEVIGEIAGSIENTAADAVNNTVENAFGGNTGGQLLGGPDATTMATFTSQMVNTAQPRNSLSDGLFQKDIDFASSFNNVLDYTDEEDDGFHSSKFKQGDISLMDVYLQSGEDPAEFDMDETNDLLGKKPQEQKVAQVTAQAEDIDNLYILANVEKKHGEFSKHVIEYLTLRPAVEKLTRSLINNSGTTGRNSLPPLPGINLSLTIDGIAGLSPGDVFNVDYIPAQYGKDFVAGGVHYGPLLMFMVMDLKTDVTVDGWNTSFTGMASLNEEANSVLSTYTAEEIDAYFSLDISKSFGIENLPYSYLGKIKDFINVVGDFADSVGNFFSDALEYQSQVSASRAKTIADAEGDDDVPTINTLDGNVSDASEQDGSFWEKVAGIPVMAAEPARGAAVGIGTIAKDAGGRILSFLGGGQQNLMTGDKNPTGGEQSNVTKEVNVVSPEGSDKLPQNIEQEVNDKVGSPDENIKGNIAARIKNAQSEEKANSRKAVVSANAPKPNPRWKQLLTKIKFRHDDGGVIQSENSSDVTITVNTFGEYNGEEHISQTLRGGQADDIEKMIKDAQETNERKIAAVFADRFPDEQIAGTGGTAKKNPGYPFSSAAWNPATGFNAEPWGQWPSALEARAALAQSKTNPQTGTPYDSYTQYKNDFGSSQRKEHWDSNDSLW